MSGKTSSKIVDSLRFADVSLLLKTEGSVVSRQVPPRSVTAKARLRKFARTAEKSIDAYHRRVPTTHSAPLSMSEKPLKRKEHALHAVPSGRLLTTSCRIKGPQLSVMSAQDAKVFVLSAERALEVVIIADIRDEVHAVLLHDGFS